MTTEKLTKVLQALGHKVVPMLEDGQEHSWSHLEPGQWEFWTNYSDLRAGVTLRTEDGAVTLTDHAATDLAELAGGKFKGE